MPIYPDITVICETCKEELWHDTRYCPYFNVVFDEENRGSIWKECVCLVHGCYDPEDLSDWAKNAVEEQQGRKTTSTAPVLLGQKLFLSDVVLKLASIPVWEYKLLSKYGHISFLNDLFGLKKKELAKRITFMRRELDV